MVVDQYQTDLKGGRGRERREGGKKGGKKGGEKGGRERREGGK